MEFLSPNTSANKTPKAFKIMKCSVNKIPMEFRPRNIRRKNLKDFNDLNNFNNLNN
ncbi:MAG: hypothetical protein LBF79_03915 [Dysgonamonadaceae bacterium]|nr:hypothetical protein [Dysgonamonadaceae bacterium]